MTDGKCPFPLTLSTYGKTTREWDSNYLGIAVPLFPALSTVNHVWSAVAWDKYSEFVDLEYNPVRWLEYSASSSVMVWIIASLSGVSGNIDVGLSLSGSICASDRGERIGTVFELAKLYSNGQKHLQAQSQG